MNELVELLSNKFGPCLIWHGPCLLVWQRNEQNIGLLIDTYHWTFCLVEKNPHDPYSFSSDLYRLFRGFITEPQPGRWLFNFEYQYSKTSSYILNEGCKFSALSNILYSLQGRGIDVVLSFKEDVRKVYYKFANNTFWNPARKKYFTLNRKYDEHAVTGRYHRINDTDSIIEKR